MFPLIEEPELLVTATPVTLTLTVHLLVPYIGGGRGELSLPEVLFQWLLIPHFSLFSFLALPLVTPKD